MPIGVCHILRGSPAFVRDPLTGNVLVFEEDDLAAAVATLLANGGFVATRLAPAPDGKPVQTVASEEEALAVVRLLVAELSLVEDVTARGAARN